MLPQKQSSDRMTRVDYLGKSSDISEMLPELEGVYVPMLRLLSNEIFAIGATLSMPW